MQVQILPGEYLFSEEGFHILDEHGFATVATEETLVEITDQERLDFIAMYQDFVRNGG